MTFDYHAWVERNRDKLRAYHREWMRKRRADPVYRAAERAMRLRREGKA